jgi:hypothetical protein
VEATLIPCPGRACRGFKAKLWLKSWQKSTGHAELYAKYKDRIQFVLVYSREAYSHNGRRVPNNLIKNIICDELTTDEERTEVGLGIQINLDLHMSSTKAVSPRTPNRYSCAAIGSWW